VVIFTLRSGFQRKNPYTHLEGGFTDPKIGLDDLEDENVPAFAWIRISGPHVRNPDKTLIAISRLLSILRGQSIKEINGFERSKVLL
jgi:hypothetical protein